MRNLKVMQHLFYRPMSDDPAIPKDFVTLLFPNIDDMIELHGEFVVDSVLHAFHGVVFNRVNHHSVLVLAGSNVRLLSLLL